MATMKSDPAALIAELEKKLDQQAAMVAEALRIAGATQELVSASISMHSAILSALIDAKVVDRQHLCDYLSALIRDLRPEEREQAHGYCLLTLATAINEAPKSRLS